MINNTISFGKQIPLTRCQVKDAITERFVPATMYEVDCKNAEDYTTVEQAYGRWAFKDYILSNMKTKMLVNNIPSIRTSDKFYLLKTDSDKNVIGMMQVTDKNEEINIKFIETRKDHRYKYAGQNMLAALAFKEKGKPITVNAPLKSAVMFYMDKCGFIVSDKGKLCLPASQTDELLRTTENKTQTKLINLQG